MGTIMNLMLNNAGGSWTIDTFLSNLGDALVKWGGMILIVLGAAMIIAAAFFIAKGLMSQGRGQTNWALVFILLIVGGVFFAGGVSSHSNAWNTFAGISGGLGNSANQLGTGKSNNP